MEEVRKTPVFVINGFLESGKTTFIRDAIVQDPEMEHERVVVLCYEEGEVEMEDLPANIHVLVAEEKEEFTADLLRAIDEKYDPTYVIIEYNGIWGMKTLYDADLPENWRYSAQFTVINAETFEMYFENMKGIFADMLRMSARVFVNRCTRSDDFKYFKDSIKSCCPHAEIIYMNDEEGFLDIMLEEDLPYDIHGDLIAIDRDDYMTWYIDMQDYPERYEGKLVEFEAQVARPEYFREDFFLAGNMVMTCCEDDMQFLGFACQHEKAQLLKEGNVMKIRGIVRNEFAPEYEMEGPVIYVEKTTTVQGQNKKKKKK